MKIQGKEDWRMQKLKIKMRTNSEVVRKAMRKMKRGKAVGPDSIPIESWKCLGKMEVTWLTKLFSMILGGERMPDFQKQRRCAKLK